MKKISVALTLCFLLMGCSTTPGYGREVAPDGGLVQCDPTKEECLCLFEDEVEVLNKKLEVLEEKPSNSYRYLIDGLILLLGIVGVAK